MSTGVQDYSLTSTSTRLFPSSETVYDRRIRELEAEVEYWRRMHYLVKWAPVWCPPAYDYDYPFWSVPVKYCGGC